MSSEDINDRLRQLSIEDFIWIIYIFIIILSFYSNSIERKYFVTGNEEDKEKYRNIITIIFLILVVAYSYFLKDSIDSLKKMDESTPYKTRRLNYLSFIASLLVFISGFIFLYIALEDEDLNVELAFS